MLLDGKRFNLDGPDCYIRTWNHIVLYDPEKLCLQCLWIFCFHWRHASSTSLEQSKTICYCLKHKVRRDISYISKALCTEFSKSSSKFDEYAWQTCFKIAWSLTYLSPDHKAGRSWKHFNQTKILKMQLLVNNKNSNYNHFLNCWSHATVLCFFTL